MTTDGAVYTWGFGGYGRLGHNEPADGLSPRAVETFEEPVRTRAGGPLGPPDGAVGITCGSACTLVIRKSGSTVFFGKTKTSGEATMYPKPIEDLNGWRVRAFGAGNTSIVISAEKSVIAWGPSPTRGELGYGKGEKTSSTKPQKMNPMENYIVTQIACGHSHTLMVITGEDEDGLKKLAKFKPKPPKDIGERPAEVKKGPVKKKPVKKKAAGAF